MPVQSASRHHCRQGFRCSARLKEFTEHCINGEGLHPIHITLGLLTFVRSDTSHPSFIFPGVLPSRQIHIILEPCTLLPSDSYRKPKSQPFEFSYFTLTLAVSAFASVSNLCGYIHLTHSAETNGSIAGITSGLGDDGSRQTS